MTLLTGELISDMIILIFHFSLVGIVLMFAGLYVVLWAKNREDKMSAELATPSDETESDVERPFLQ
jgi:uncharacterized membrane protein